MTKLTEKIRQGHEVVETDLLTKRELAKKLRVTEKTLENWQNAGYIKKLTIGGTVRYSWPDVVASIKSQSV